MKCPFCASEETQVLESRAVEEGKAVRRRRECSKCSKRFTTYEKTRNNFLWVVKKEGKREPFDKEKIKRGTSRTPWGARPYSRPSGGKSGAWNRIAATVYPRINPLVNKITRGTTPYSTPSKIAAILT